jgi:hypothetical protein
MIGYPPGMNGHQHRGTGDRSFGNGEMSYDPEHEDN